MQGGGWGGFQHVSEACAYNLATLASVYNSALLQKKLSGALTPLKGDLETSHTLWN